MGKKVYFILKRCFDWVSAVILMLVLFFPVLIIVIVIKLEDGGPAFYYQNRLGKDGKIFKLYKFRSMILNADEVLQEKLKEDKEIAKEYKKYKKLENDFRITKIGNFIRKTSLDELPQIINILKGDMSFIGPRPYLEIEEEDMGRNKKTILTVTPGLTGYWQAYGRNNTTFKERVKMETYYAKNLSLLFDIKIFFKTMLVVVKKDGAK